MAKKFGRLVVFGVIAGAAAAGVYHYLQTKDKAPEDFDDFDDLDNFEDISDEDKTNKGRGYITLDNAKVLVNDTIDKAKDVISKASKKIQETFEDASNKNSDNPVEEVVDAEKTAEADTDTSAAASETDAEESTEEFFDDEV